MLLTQPGNTIRFIAAALDVDGETQIAELVAAAWAESIAEEALAAAYTQILDELDYEGRDSLSDTLGCGSRKEELQTAYLSGDEDFQRLAVSAAAQCLAEMETQEDGSAGPTLRRLLENIPSPWREDLSTTALLQYARHFVGSLN